MKLNEVNSRVLTLESLIRDGLYHLAPHLINREGLWIPVNDIRMGEIFRRPTAWSTQDIKIAKRLASNMLASLYLAFFIALFSLQKREADDCLFVESITKAYLGT